MGFLCCPPKHMLQPLFSFQHLPSCSILPEVEIPQRLMLQFLLETVAFMASRELPARSEFIHIGWLKKEKESDSSIVLGFVQPLMAISSVAGLAVGA